MRSVSEAPPDRPGPTEKLFLISNLALGFMRPDTGLGETTAAAAILLHELTTTQVQRRPTCDGKKAE